MAGHTTVLSGVDICIKTVEFTEPGIWCNRHYECFRQVLIHYERNRLLLPAINASLCYGLSSVARIAEQLGIDKTYVKVQYNPVDMKPEEKSPAGFGIGGPYQKPTGSAIGV